MRSARFVAIPLLIGLATACAHGTDVPADSAPVGGLPDTAGGAAGAAGAAGAGGGSGTGGTSAAGKGGSGTAGGAGASAGTGGAAGKGGSAGAGGAAGSGGSAGAAGAAGKSGAGGGSSGGAAGASGTGGGAGGSSAGTGGSAGANGGTAGAGGGTAGGAGTGGSGTGGSGTSGSGGASTTPTTLVAVASQGATAALGATFTVAGGWKTSTLAMATIGKPSVGSFNGGALVVARLSGGGLNQLQWSGNFGSFTPIATAPTANDGPSLATSGASAVIAFLDNTGKHKAAFWGGSGFSAPAQLGGDGTPAFGVSTSTVARSGPSTWAAYSGADEGLYVTHHDGASWTISSGVMGAGTKADMSPFTVLANDGHPIVLFVRNSDSAVCVTENPGPGWTAPKAISTAFTSKPIAAAVTTNGALVIAWHGFNDEGIYAAERTPAGIWSAVLTLDKTAGLASGPTVTPGVDTDDAEVLYARAGELRHVRIASAAAFPPVTVSATGALDVGAAVLAP